MSTAAIQILPSPRQHPRLFRWLAYEAAFHLLFAIPMTVPYGTLSFVTLGHADNWCHQHPYLGRFAALLPALLFQWISKRLWPGLTDPMRLSADEHERATALQARLATVSTMRLLLSYFVLALPLFLLLKDQPWAAPFFTGSATLTIGLQWLIEDLKKTLPNASATQPPKLVASWPGPRTPISEHKPFHSEHWGEPPQYPGAMSPNA